MLDAVADLFSSKKFVAAIAGVVAAVALRLGWDVSVEEILSILSPLIAAILGQGIADHGKERVYAQAALKAVEGTDGDS